MKIINTWKQNSRRVKLWWSGFFSQGLALLRIAACSGCIVWPSVCVSHPRIPPTMGPKYFGRKKTTASSKNKMWTFHTQDNCSHSMCLAFASIYAAFMQASLEAQWQKIHLLMQETWVRSLLGEDPLEKEMATHSSILAWRIPWKRSLVGVYRVAKESDMT